MNGLYTQKDQKDHNQIQAWRGNHVQSQNIINVIYISALFRSDKHTHTYTNTHTYTPHI